MELSETSLCGVAVLRVVGELDHANSPAVVQKAAIALGPDSTCIIFDLEACTYFDSGGVGVLLALLDQVRNRGWVGILSPSRQVLRILEIVGLTEAPDFKVFSSTAEAQEQCNARKKDVSC
jgi:anti-anti-sigma factor